ncbi:MAG: hypothetical protein ACRDGM_18155 [bacterium]
MATVALAGLSHVDAKQIAEFAWDGFKNSRLSAQANRRLLLGRDVPPLPDEFIMKDREQFQVVLPQTMTVALHAKNSLAARYPALVRPQIGESEAAGEVSTRIEQFINPVCRKLVRWADIVDIILNEGWACSIVQPLPTYWRQTPSLYADSARKKLNPVYHRDYRGRAATDVYYKNDRSRRFKMDRKQTTVYFDGVKDRYLAGKLPFINRVLGPMDAAPIMGPGMTLDGLVVRQRFSATSLLKDGYWWGTGDRLVPAGTIDDNVHIQRGQNVEMTELWLSDEHGPHIIYSVDNKPTWIKDGDSYRPAIINLEQDYGICELPITHEWGLSWAVSNPDDRAVPFTQPYQKSWRAANAIATGMAISLWRHGFPSFLTYPDKNTTPEYWLNSDERHEIRIKPLTVTEAPGPVQQVGSESVSRDATQLISLLMGAAEHEGPGGGAFGAAAPSAIDRSLGRRYFEDANGQAVQAALTMYARTAEMLLEQSCIIGTLEGTNVRVFELPDTSFVVQRGRQSNTQVVIDLEPGDVGDTFTLIAELPTDPMDNFARVEQASGIVLKQLRYRTWFHEKIMGDDAPEQTELLIMLDQIRALPEYKQALLQQAISLEADEKAKELAILVAGGRVDQSGTPSSFMAGMQGPSQAGPGVSGDGVSGVGLGQTPGHAQLAGIVSGTSQTAATNRIARQGGVQSPGAAGMQGQP